MAIEYLKQAIGKVELSVTIEPSERDTIIR